jgi:hypothetical protein
MWRTGNRTLEGKTIVSNRIEYKLSPQWKFTYLLHLAQVKENRYSGGAKHFSRKHRWQLQWNFPGNWKWKPYMEREDISYRSEFYPLKNYGIERFSYGFPIHFDGLVWRFKGEWQYAGLQGASNRLVRNVWKFSGRYERKKWISGVQIKFVNNRFEGNPLSPAGFVMLEGLLPGKNLIFDFQSGWKIRKDMQFNLFYQFRKNIYSQAVHTGHFALTVRF